MQQLINKFAPNLQPKIIPMGFNDDNMRALFSANTTQESSSISFDTIISKHIPSNHCCTVNNCGVKQSSPLHFVSIPHIDFSKNTFTIQDVHYMCSNCYQCSDLNQFLEICVSRPVLDSSSSLQQQKQSTTTNTLIQHFAKVNNITDIHTIQEIYNVAYALRTTSSYLPLSFTLETADLDKFISTRLEQKKNKKQHK